MTGSFNLNQKSKRVVLDMIINLIGTALPLVALQLVVYPIVARTISAEAYGRMQSLTSVIFLISGTIGSALSTTRLIHQYDYDENHRTGDFSVLNFFSAGAVAILTPIVVSIYLGGIEILELLLITIISLLNYSELYFEVGLRLKLNYKRIFVNKLIGALGYLLGYLIFTKTLDWHYIFICSYLLQNIYCILCTELIREPIRKTEAFADTMKSFGNLSLASVFNKALTYFDKLLLYPLLGGEAVSVYYAANIFGKLVLQVLEPITNVILSYLSKEKSVSRSVWRITIPVGAAFCIIMYIFCLLVSRFALNILYPQWVDEAMLLIPISTLSLCISSFANIINPLVLKAIETNRQIIINASGLVIYVVLALIFHEVYGLIGCCWALLFSNAVKVTLMLLFCFGKKRSA